jgi:hypothetical protein
MGPHRGRGASGLSPSSLPSKMEPPSFGEARTEPGPHRASSPATARRHRTPPAAARGDKPLPPHPHPFHEHQSTHRVTENTRRCPIGRASPSPASSSSSELAGLRLPCPSVPDCGGPPVSCQARAGRPSRPRARESWAEFFRAGPVIRNEIHFYYFVTDFCTSWKNVDLGF